MFPPLFFFFLSLPFSVSFFYKYLPIPPLPLLSLVGHGWAIPHCFVCMYTYELPSRFDLRVFIWSIIVILFAMFFGGLYSLSLFFLLLYALSVHLIGHILTFFFPWKICSYKLFSFLLLLINKKQQRWKRENEKERDSMHVGPCLRKRYYT